MSEIITELNKDLVRRLYDRLMAHGDTAAADQVLSPDYVDHDVPGRPTPGGPEELKQAVLAVRASLPDITPVLSDLIAQGDFVSVRVEATGTHTGAPFLGIEPSGRQLVWREQHQFRCRNGRIVEHRGVFDMAGIMAQLGLLPMPA